MADAREKLLGTPSAHSYEASELESFRIALRSTALQWYRLRFVGRWYDVSHPGEVRQLESPEVFIRFRPDVRNLPGWIISCAGVMHLPCASPVGMIRLRRMCRV